MRKLNEIATDLRNLLTDKFSTIRISALQTSDQLLKEIQAINPEKLPGVIIVFDGLKFEGEAFTNTAEFTLVLVDRFKAGGEDRALSIQQSASELMQLFPADGREINGVWYYPDDCVAADPDSQVTALAVGLTVKQGSV